jgi:hypothetical protein
MRKKKIKKILFILCLLCLTPALSSAAEFSFGAAKDFLAPNEDFLVPIFLDSNNESVNALEGAISFPQNTLELKEIRDGNSTVNFWIEKPHGVASGSIVFSGITAGGFSGLKNFLFSMVFRAKQTGSGSIKFENAQVLQNNGLGTKTSVSGRPFNFSVSDENKISNPDSLTIKDNERPEIFKPHIGNDPAIYSGGYFLAFSAQDKGSGLDHYEVREGYWGKYNVAESPYLLADQSLDKKIYVKAIDKNGNETVVVLNALKPARWYLYCLIIVIILLICILIFKKVWSNFTK